MNITPQFLKSPSFVKFERDIGNEALSVLVKIGMHCQQLRTPYLEIQEDMDVEILAETKAGTGALILGAMVKYGLTQISKENPSQYLMLFFEQMNAQLLSNWANGELKKQRARDASQDVHKPQGRSFVAKPAVRAAVFGRDNHKCVYCGSENDLEIDHIVPLARGGENELGNLQTLCKPCNTIKNDSMEPSHVSMRTNSMQSNQNEINSNQSKATACLATEKQCLATEKQCLEATDAPF